MGEGSVAGHPGFRHEGAGVNMRRIFTGADVTTDRFTAAAVMSLLALCG